jgi:hypothetical protein
MDAHIPWIIRKTVSAYAGRQRISKTSEVWGPTGVQSASKRTRPPAGVLRIWAVSGEYSLLLGLGMLLTKFVTSFQPSDAYLDDNDQLRRCCTVSVHAIGRLTRVWALGVHSVVLSIPPSDNPDVSQR